ncbi:hypothetical protein SAMD00019534_064850 [Acytostelium subglobosum LB1]|uniref:hypothetical protein n=1 Tax=Acytostelium subglobosum LB1 TaxID=1410327 RepID=UPI000644AC93|nr:hypothetical protein SAMD00019534_064850 [Acytostelium subglobosum LB1]GAM23310.1 hypothetical protein SAMD00019534_064850 [Acytostelium subglobosum LB1]|eukprot:XP_012753759.1 hypothetical protein SAMD00019534_064850 [Acytostelium subglobosum LB1]
MSRMKLLWSTLKELATKHQTLTQASKQVTERCKELHELIILQEHRINSQINDRVHQTSSAINDIINEIESINNVFRSSKNKINDGMEMDNIVQLITSSTTIDQFIDQSFTSTSPNSDQPIEISNSSNELLALVQQSVRLKYESHFKHIPRCLVDIDHDTLDGIKHQLRTCFELLEETAHNRNCLMVISEATISIYSPFSDTWSLLDHKPKKWETSLTSVYARGKVYLFSGNEEPSTFAWYSLDDGQWYNYDILEDNSDDYEAASYYDGDKLIYIATTDDEDESWIYTFNIETQQFSCIGQLPMYCDSRYHFVINNQLIFVDAVLNRKDEEDSSQTVEFFNLATLQIEKSYPLPWPVNTCCFDGKDILYMLSMVGEFLSISLVTGKITHRASPPGPVETNTLSCGPEKGTLILLQGPNKNFRYSIRKNEWTCIADNIDLFDRDENFIPLVLSDRPFRR